MYIPTLSHILKHTRVETLLASLVITHTKELNGKKLVCLFPIDVLVVVTLTRAFMMVVVVCRRRLEDALLS